VTKVTLQRYLENSWLQRHETSPQEITELLAIADRDIGQSQTPGLGPEWRLSIAYNAALQLATAVLAAAGYRAERQNKHQRTIECLAFTLGLERRAIDFFDVCRRKRHSNVYDQVGAGLEKGVRSLLSERPGGCFAQKAPDPNGTVEPKVLRAFGLEFMPRG
jgi:hypothetical protein